MAIRSMDDLIAAKVNTYTMQRSGFLVTTARWMDMWSMLSGSFDTTLAGVVLDSGNSNGFMGGMLFPCFNPTPSPDSAKNYLGRVVFFNSGSFGIGVINDRLWHNGGFTITSTGSQTVNSPTWPARDQSGSSDGLGVQVALTVSSAVGAASPNVTLTYTNSDGVGSRTSVIAGASSAGNNSMWLFPLQEDDKGVRSIQSLQLSASWVSGTINLCAFRRLAQVEVSSGGYANELDLIGGGMPQLYNGTVPFLMFESSSSNSTYLWHTSCTVLQG